jgi:hypothetical protein
MISIPLYTNNENRIIIKIRKVRLKYAFSIGFSNGVQRLGYEKLRGLALNFASTHQTENPRGFSEVGENKQLLIAIVSQSFFHF